MSRKLPHQTMDISANPLRQLDKQQNTSYSGWPETCSTLILDKANMFLVGGLTPLKKTKLLKFGSFPQVKIKNV